LTRKRKIESVYVAILVGNRGATNQLTLDQLQKKTLVLLTATAIWRPRSDLRSLQHEDVISIEFEGKIIGATLIARQSIEFKPKAGKLGKVMGEISILRKLCMCSFCSPPTYTTI
jgi:hypothetical protein